MPRLRDEEEFEVHAPALRVCIFPANLMTRWGRVLGLHALAVAIALHLDWEDGADLDVIADMLGITLDDVHKAVDVLKKERVLAPSNGGWRLADAVQLEVLADERGT